MLKRERKRAFNFLVLIRFQEQKQQEVILLKSRQRISNGLIILDQEGIQQGSALFGDFPTAKF